jgi:NADH-quinone oxidoreductase subunit M
MLYDRRHTRQLDAFGGIARSMPVYATFFMIVMLSSVGLPGLNGFVGEFLILIGTYTSVIPYAKYYAVIAATGVIFAACYMLWMFQRVMFGPIKNEKNKNLPDLNTREIVYLTMILVFIVWIGVYPKTFLDRSQVTIDHTISLIEKGHQQTLAQWNPGTAQEGILFALKGQRQ